MSVAVVILNWNGKELLAQFLPTVVKNSNLEEVNIYVVDNGSTDDSISFVEKNFPEIKIIKLDKNYGFAGGYNRALALINEDYSILLNSDVEVTKEWIKPIISYLENNQDVVACQPKILSYNNKHQFEYAGAAGGYIDKYGYPFCRGRIFNVFEEDNLQYQSVEPIFWASGAALVIRTNLFKELGGFDEFFFAHMEEIDLCWRIWARGYKIVYIPSSVIYHLGGATLSKTNPHKTYLNFRNNLFLLYKNLHYRYKSIMFIRHILDVIAFLKFLIGLEFKNAYAIIKAYIDFFKYRKRYKSIREMNKKMEIVIDIPVVYKGSIVYDFFILRKRFFHELNFLKNEPSSN